MKELNLSDGLAKEAHFQRLNGLFKIDHDLPSIEHAIELANLVSTTPVLDQAEIQAEAVQAILTCCSRVLSPLYTESLPIETFRRVLLIIINQFEYRSAVSRVMEIIIEVCRNVSSGTLELPETLEDALLVGI
jgi:hypothetical protein